MHINRSREEFEWEAFRRKKTAREKAFSILHCPNSEMDYVSVKTQLLACRVFKPSHLFIYLVFTFLLATFAAKNPTFHDKLSEVLSANSPKSPRYLRSSHSFRKSREVKERWRRSLDSETATLAEPTSMNSLTTNGFKSPYYLYSPGDLPKTMEGDYESGSFLDNIESMFSGPVCTIIDVRNTPENLKELENCTIVNGFVQIVFMHNTEKRDFEKYTFPKLRVITEYLLLYRVYGLHSLRRLFPNLSVIGGRGVFYKYALVVYENPHLEELGLENLQLIQRGGVRIQKNNKLCYLHTVNWESLGKLGDKIINYDLKNEVVIRDNRLSDDKICLNQCGEEHQCSWNGTQYCWGRQVCQKRPCPVNCPNACKDGQCVCHKECLAGCSSPNNASACFSCRNAYHDGECVAKCPVGSYLENNWRCVTKEWCYGVTWLIYGDQCLKYCPSGYSEQYDPEIKYYCVYCGKNCKKICNDMQEYTVSDRQSLNMLSGCTSIPGRLTINISGGVDILSDLEYVLQGLEEVGSLIVRGSESLASLAFLKNLKKITGVKSALKDETYSLYVLNNQNLRGLFPSIHNSSDAVRDEEIRNKFSIGGGKVFFHFNPRLCLREIQKVSSLTKLEEDDKDISEITNGDRATCDMKPLHIKSVEHMPMENLEFATVRITWHAVNITDPRTLIGYQVIYQESKFRNATRFEGISACSKSSWSIKDTLVNPNSARFANGSGTNDAILHFLRPFTQYAFYVQTYTTSSARKGAQSNITYFMTKTAEPSAPLDLTARAVNLSSIIVEWKPPEFPNGIITHYIVRWRRQKEDEELLKSVNLCKQDGALYPINFPEPDIPEVITPTAKPTVKPDGKICCSCDSKKILPKHEEVAKNNMNFENFLHNRVFQLRYLALIDDQYTSYYNVRRKRSAELDFATEDSENDVFNGTFVISENGTSRMITIAEPYTTEPLNVSEEMLPSPESPTVQDDQDRRYIWHSVTTVNTRIILTNLHHFSEYEIHVFVCNRDSAANSSLSTTTSEKCSIETITAKRTSKLNIADEIPPTSFNRTTVNVRTRSGSRLQPALRWMPPTNPNGYIKFYKVQFEIKDSNQRLKEYLHYEDYCYPVSKYIKNDGTYPAPLTLPPGLYRGRVMPVTLAGEGLWTSWKTFDIPSNDKSDKELSRIAAIVGGVGFLIISLLCFLYCRKKRSKSKNDMIDCNPEYFSVTTTYVPDGYEVPEEDVELIKEIGHGNFGKVFVGVAKNIVKGQERTQVAIKKLHDKSGIHKRMEFLEEANVMKAFNSTHVVRLLGVVSQTFHPLVIMEFMEKGDLKSHLRVRREDAEDGPKYPPPTLDEKVQMAAEIADGMMYLSAIKYVHRDLAARNCLVHRDGTVKIGDFGLTRDIYETDYYRKESRGLLPIRWMSPESLKDGTFDSRSDIWSYGIVLWEIASLAEQPYQGLQHDEVTRFVIDGGYMERPKGCPSKLYDLMLNCWEFTSSMRPTFKEILLSLQNDVNDRFREESYYFEQLRQEISESNQDDDITVSSHQGFVHADGSLKFSCTPINLTPSRSRSHTPCSCQTPTKRYSDDSSKQSTIHDGPSAALTLETKLLLNDNNQLRVSNGLGLLEISTSKPLWNKIFKASEYDDRQMSFCSLKSLENCSPPETELILKVDCENSHPGLLSNGVDASKCEDLDPAYAMLSSPTQLSTENPQPSFNTEIEHCIQNTHQNGIIKRSPRNWQSKLVAGKESFCIDSTPKQGISKQCSDESFKNRDSLLTPEPVLSQTTPLLKS